MRKLSKFGRTPQPPAAPEALPGQIDRLVATNWPRALLWTVRSAALAYLVISAARR